MHNIKNHLTSKGSENNKPHWKNSIIKEHNNKSLIGRSDHLNLHYHKFRDLDICPDERKILVSGHIGFIKFYTSVEDQVNHLVTKTNLPTNVDLNRNKHLKLTIFHWHMHLTYPLKNCQYITTGFKNILTGQQS